MHDLGLSYRKVSKTSSEQAADRKDGQTAELKRSGSIDKSGKRPKRRQSLEKNSKTASEDKAAKPLNETAPQKRVSFSHPEAPNLSSGGENDGDITDGSASNVTPPSASSSSVAVGGRRLPLKGPALSPIHSDANTPLMSREPTAAPEVRSHVSCISC